MSYLQYMYSRNIEKLSGMSIIAPLVRFHILMHLHDSAVLAVMLPLMAPGPSSFTATTANWYSVTEDTNSNMKLP